MSKLVKPLCVNCITLAICKSKCKSNIILKNYGISSLHMKGSIIKLADECILLYDYITEEHIGYTVYIWEKISEVAKYMKDPL